MVSTRTPEGTPGHCPVCGAEVRIEPSQLFGDAPCPRCGCLLWFVATGPTNGLFFEYEAADLLRDRFLEMLSQALGVSKHQLEAEPSQFPTLASKAGFDSLDLTELVLEIEDEFYGNH